MYANTATTAQHVPTARRGITLLLMALLATGATFQLATVTRAAAQPEITDATVTDAVSDALFADHGVPGYVINIETKDGIVELSGAVNNIMAKDRAVRVAETVKGVRGVIDRMKVADIGRSDETIRDDVQDALIVDPATDSWEISTSVSDGTVTLKGTVESWQEKQLAGKVAKSVRGVRGLENDIDVAYQMTRTDEQIEADIERALDWNVLVDDALIEVSVHNNEVTLTGTVGSAAERRQARWDAWVTGVDAVDAGGLEVADWARDERFRKDKYVEKGDDEIRRAIKDAFKYDPRVTARNIHVNVDDGVVRLDGKVDNLKSKQSAARTARHVVGVWRVKNRIDVRPSTPSDATIADNIRDALRRDPYVERFEIDVWVNNGEANLTGTVDSYYEKFQAGDVAAGIYGVVAVDNNLVVNDDYDIYTYDPYVDDDWYVYDYDWYTYPNGYTTTKTDWEIRDDIQDELWWSPFVDSDEVTVAVDDGMVTLTGIVDTWSERTAATEEAYEGGAVAVDNDITVDYGPDYYQP